MCCSCLNLGPQMAHRATVMVRRQSATYSSLPPRKSDSSLGRRQDAELQAGGMFGRMVDPLRGPLVVFRFREVDVRHERLRIAIDQREPGALDLHHQPMTLAEAVQHIQQLEADPRRLAGLE